MRLVWQMLFSALKLRKLFSGNLKNTLDSVLQCLSRNIFHLIMSTCVVLSFIGPVAVLFFWEFQFLKGLNNMNGKCKVGSSALLMVPFFSFARYTCCSLPRWPSDKTASGQDRI